jgi:hypothetical protein
MPSCLQFLMLEDRLGVVETHFGNSRLLRFALLGLGFFGPCLGALHEYYRLN